MNLPKKLTIRLMIILLVFGFFFSSVRQIFAVNTPDVGSGGSIGGSGYYDPTFYKHQVELEDAKKNQTVELIPWVQTVFTTNINSFNHSVLGEGICTSGQPTCQINSPGALGGISNLISLVYANPPASGIEYIADLRNNFFNLSPVYAQQGIGFAKLTPILPIWKTFRNLSYLLFVFIFIVTGLAIMFRTKISPQAVLTIESALPKIIVALVAVTFSYAIAGFMIDLIYILIGIIIAVLSQTGFLNASVATNVYMDADLATLVGEYTTRGPEFMNKVAEPFSLAYQAAKWLPAGVLQDAAQWFLNIPVLGGLIKSVNSPGYPLVMAVLLIALLFSLFKLFFTLLMTYISIILSIIFGPIIIMLSALPGQDTFKSWLKNLLQNILVFPAVIGIFLLADVILRATDAAKNTGNLWAPPFLFSLDASFIGGLIAFGLLLLAPKVPEYVKALFDEKAKVSSPMAVFGGAGSTAMGVVDLGYQKTIGEKAALAEEAYRKSKTGGMGYPATAPPEKWRHLPASLFGRR